MAGVGVGEPDEDEEEATELLEETELDGTVDDEDESEMVELDSETEVLPEISLELLKTLEELAVSEEPIASLDVEGASETEVLTELASSGVLEEEAMLSSALLDETEELELSEELAWDRELEASVGTSDELRVSGAEEEMGNASLEAGSSPADESRYSSSRFPAPQNWPPLPPQGKEQSSWFSASELPPLSSSPQ